MKTQITLLAIAALPAAVFAQTRIYFNEDWEVTTQDKMVFYRETTREGNLYHIRDFYKNGTPQMDALSHNNDPNNEVYEGKVTYYNEDGTQQSYSYYKNGELDGETFRQEKNGDYSRTLYKKGETISSESRTYDADTGQTQLEKYANGNTTRITYDKDPKGIREEEVMSAKGGTEVRYYGEGGRLLGTVKDNEDGSMTGTRVTYFTQPMRVAKIEEYRKGDIVGGIAYYTTGQLQQQYALSGKNGSETTYDPTGKIIGKFSFKMSEDGDRLQKEGTEFVFDEGKMVSATTYKNNHPIRSEEYKNGKLWQLTEFETGDNSDFMRRQTTYHPDGRVQYVLNYKDGDRYEGTFTNGTTELDYRAGTLVAERANYDDGRLHYSITYDRTAGTETGTVYLPTGEKYNEYVSRDGESGYFTGSVSFYTQGRKGRALEFREGLLQGGKMRYFTYEFAEPVELEYDGRNYWQRFFKEGELMREIRVPAKFSEVAPKLDLQDLQRTQPGDGYDTVEVVDAAAVPADVAVAAVEAEVRDAREAVRDAREAARDAARAARAARDTTTVGTK